MSTAKVTTPAGPRFIPEARNQSGFLVSRTGPNLKVYINSTLFGVDGNLSRESATAFLNTKGSAAALSDPDMQKLLLKWGQNPNGYFVEDHEAAKKREQEQEGQKVLNGATPISFYRDCFGRLACGTRLPALIWAKVKPYAEYISGNDDDMEFYDDQYPGARRSEVRGWVYKPKAITVLAEAGYMVEYCGTAVSHADDLAAVDAGQRQQQEQHYATIAEIKRTESVFEASFRTLETTAGYDLATATSAEIKAGPRICAGTWTGATIYGGGRWFHLIGNDLVLVINNGHDGDNWGRNNYDTGGAGAIAYRAQGQAQVLYRYQTWIESLGQYAAYLK